MEAVIEISREEFQARKKRRIEAKRSKAANVLFVPDIKIKGENKTDPSAPPSPDEEPITEISGEEFQARCKKRRIEEMERSEATNKMPFTSSLFVPSIKEENGRTRDRDDDPLHLRPRRGPTCSHLTSSRTNPLAKIVMRRTSTLITGGTVSPRNSVFASL